MKTDAAPVKWFTITGADLTRAITWAQYARNNVQYHYRAELGITTLHQPASESLILGVKSSGSGARAGAL